GFYTAVDPTDYNIVYSESQDGNTNRYDLRTGRGQSIRPRAPAGARGTGAGRGGGGGGGAAAQPAGGTETAAEQAPPVQAGGFGAAQGPPNVLNATAGD